MPNHAPRLLTYALTGFLLVGVAACGDDETTSPPGDPPEFTAADGLNGGQMYDKFWAEETGWNQSDPNLATFSSYSNFFRCKQCHAWDRLGNAASYIGRAPSTSRPNVSSVNLKQVTASMTPQELFDALASSTGRRPLSANLANYDPATNSTVGDQMPDLSEFMSDAQIWDLAKFMLTEAIDTDDLYSSSTSGSYPTGSIDYMNIGLNGDAASGDAIYTADCASCHGADGRAFLVDGDYSVGSFLRSKPYEVQHKVKFGQLGTAMGSLVTDLGDMRDLYKALTDAAKYPDPVGPGTADGMNGGQLYDKFWASETGWDQSDTNLATFNSYSNFFRCKQCHAWDRLGNAASYIGRAPSSSRPNVSSLNLKQVTAGMTEQELFDAIKRSTGRRSLSADLSNYDPVTNSTVGDQMPDYSEFMEDGPIWDLVLFLKDEAIDTDDLYTGNTVGTYPTGSITYSNIGAGGSATSGDAVYVARCTTCHGADGTQITVDGSFSVGSFLRAKPYELQHKLKFGQLGTGMVSSVTNLTEMLDLYLALTNATTYPDPTP